MAINWRAEPVTVAVPATSANLGPGFDTLGLALDLTDQVTAQVVDAGVTVEVTGEGAGEVATDDGHLIVATMGRAFSRLGVSPPPGLRLTCANRIPHARGLGSSSAAIVAGILLARALAGQPTDDAAARADALVLAAQLEGHPDNVAPCLLGGFTIAWTEAAGSDRGGDPGPVARAVRLAPAAGLRPVVFVPQMRGLTAHARAALPAQVPHVDAVFNVARVALLVHALTAAPEHLLTATEDRLHQPYRASSMPATADLVGALRTAGVPAVVSGAGPSVLAFTDARATMIEAPAGWLVRPLDWSATGARIV